MDAQAPKVVTPSQSNRPANRTMLDPLVKLYHQLLPIRVIEALYAEWHPDGLEVWLVLNGATEADRERIYEQEWALMQAFPGLGLDVHLLDRQEVNLETAIDLDHVDVFLRFPEAAHA